MRLPIGFDPLEVGEIDNFVFDFTADVGSASIVTTNWSCSVAPFQSGTDAMAQARILSTIATTIIQFRSPLNGSLLTKSGSFSVATVGGMPTSAIGATYILEATVSLSDGRVLKLNSTVFCAPAGP